MGERRIVDSLKTGKDKRKLKRRLLTEQKKMKGEANDDNPN